MWFPLLWGQYALRFYVAGSLVLLQFITFLVAAKSTTSLKAGFFKLYAWDSPLYAAILDHGLVTVWPPGKSPATSSIGFFPGYPLLAMCLQHLLGLSNELALLITAQGAAIVFWIYFLAFLHRMQASVLTTIAMVAFVLSFPTSFYLITAYSESLFLASLLGFIYWLTSKHRYGYWVAGIHGFAMSATRISGLSLAALPVALAVSIFMQHPTERGLLQVRMATYLRSIQPFLIASLLCGLGGCSFFLFCQLKFGHWDAYMWRQRLGWGITPNWLAPFSLHTYALAIDNEWLGLHCRGSNCIGKSATAILGYILFPLNLFLGWQLLQARKYHVPRSYSDLLSLQFTFLTSAMVLFLFSVIGLANSQMQSMIRYVLPSMVLLVLFWGSVCSASKKKWLPICIPLVLLVLAYLLFPISIHFMYRYAHHQWVA